MRVLIVFGTRPEAIKMAPVIRALRADTAQQVDVCVTGQHRQMLDQVLDLFGIVPDVDLDLMQAGQDLTDITTATLTGLRKVLAATRYDRVLVHGDTSTTVAAALAAFFAHVPVAHVEAGLRTGDVSQPWPEEMNRRLVGRLADLHFAPTETAGAALMAENVAASAIHVTGNTGIDALQDVAGRLARDPGLSAQMAARFGGLDARKLVLVTAHRRENLGAGLDRICTALQALAGTGDVQVVFPVHLNPKVRDPVHARLGHVDNLHLIAPQDYLPFVWLMQRAHVIVTDSGGIQEEAPALGTPVLVLRDTTERPEAVAAGTVRLVGTDPARIVTETRRLIDDPEAHAAMAQAHNPYGDGKAALRIAAILSGREMPLMMTAG